jgi:hypothetical protein
MDILTIDFETYYDREFSLSKITTEEYVRSKQFETIGVAVKVNGGKTEWYSGTKEQVKFWLGKFKWHESIALAHNAMFDMAILNWQFWIQTQEDCRYFINGSCDTRHRSWWQSWRTGATLPAR